MDTTKLNEKEIDCQDLIEKTEETASQCTENSLLFSRYLDYFCDDNVKI